MRRKEEEERMKVTDEETTKTKKGKKEKRSVWQAVAVLVQQYNELRYMFRVSF